MIIIGEKRRRKSIKECSNCNKPLDSGSVVCSCGKNYCASCSTTRSVGECNLCHNQKLKANGWTIEEG